MSRLFAAQTSADKALAHPVSIIITSTMGWVLVFQLVVIAISPGFTARWLTIAVTITLVGLLLLALNRRGYTRLASYLYLAAHGLIVTVLNLTVGGIHGPGVTYYVLIVLAAGLLLGETAALVTGVIVGLTCLGQALLELAGWLPAASVLHTPLSIWAAQAMFIGITNRTRAPIEPDYQGCAAPGSGRAGRAPAHGRTTRSGD